MILGAQLLALGLLFGAPLSTGAARPAALLILGDRDPIGASLLLELTRALARESRLELSPAERWAPRKRLDACPLARRVGCWTEALSSTTGAPRVLIAVSVERGFDRLTLLSFMVDLERASAILGEERQRDRAEDRIFRATHEAPEQVIPLRSTDAIGRTAIALVDAWRTPLEELRLAGGLGRVEIVGAAGAALTLDGQALGTVDRSPARLEAVPVGLRQLVLESPRGRIEQALRVAPGEANRVEVSFPEPPPNPLRTATIIAGLAALGGGAALSAAALANARSVGCFGASGAECREFAPSMRSLGSPALAALAVGAVWSAGGWWSDRDEPPWLAIAAGIGAGAIAAISGALVLSR